MRRRAVVPVVAAALVACAPGRADAGFRESAAWRAVRTVATLPVSVAAYAVAVAARATCAWDGAGWILVCSRPSARIYGGAGTAYGAVFVARDASPDRCLRRHEARHTDQYVLGLADPVPFWVAYAVAEATKAATGGVNVFERDAGLDDGGYAPRGGHGGC